MGMGIVVGKLFTLGELVRVAAAAKAKAKEKENVKEKEKAKEKDVGLERKVAGTTEDQAYHYAYRFLLMAWAC